MSKFTFKILWLENNVGIAIDHIIGNNLSPLTSYFFWPRNDAWEELKNELESKPWINETEKIEILNQATAIINFWQETGKNKSLKKAHDRFPDFIFTGSN
uniref:Probable small ribosomal subunit protein cS23 n=5 Tax=Gelidium TaxID=2811 RepID=A0A3G2QXG7_9FLOR|nr:putative ribosomal protein 3 [Gelidium gabrielsonii]YP_009546626.1 putative ribosomal protein 3 [Gelidium kathyanniae]YP_009564918.1 putative ribosomal protein 3 [Gelidium coulteri]YP_009565118.1 putative ribosomal protein 3 [Gelidium galapagense]YP_009565318.1 putative ribosomal protein 3 [Gelidium sinicola]AYO27751.1 putative ribosomal protein 3 [Gelidium gabrielsonii]AYO27974.1 putative ribosomal protein 3 [Gelidium kathyanniae]QBA96269.1 putative ribosomal protein 3 [Gelidium coulteri